MKIEIGSNEEDHQEDFLTVDMVGSPDIIADLRHLPFNHKVEHIYCSHVLEHLSDAHIVEALKSCHGALVEDGLLEIYVPDLMWTMRKFLKADYSERWGLWLTFMYGSQDHKGQYHRTGFSPKRLSDCLIAAGFRRVDVRAKYRSLTTVEGEEHDSRLLLISDRSSRYGPTRFKEVYAQAYA